MNRRDKAATTFLHAMMAGAAMLAVMEHAEEFAALWRRLRCPHCGYLVRHPLNRHTPDNGCWTMEGN